MTSAAVVGLFRFRSPPAVVGGVPKIVVDPVNRQFWQTFAHVGEEVFESEPALADSDAASAVGFIFQVASSTEHGSPTAICGRGGVTSIMPMFQRVAQFSSDTEAATCCRLGEQAVASNYLFNSAVAETEKIRSSGFRCMRKAHDGQTTEALTRDISESGHGDLFQRLLRQEAARRFSGGPSRFCSMRGV